MIRRVPAQAAEAAYDLIVVGGGIYGVVAALESARSGLRTLLLERDDFGGATSWNSLRILHGGLRYLQSLDLPRFRESVEARSWFAAETPDLVEPLACLMPLYDQGLRRRALLGPALAMNERLRARWSSPAERALLPAGRLLDPDEVVREFPAVRQAGLRGGALWYDGYMPRPQRLLIELLLRATDHGAVALNYVEAIGWITQNGRLTGVRARDAVSGERFEFEGRAVLNCAGPWAAGLAGGGDLLLASRHAPSLAFNLLLARPLESRCSVAVEPAGGGRTYFLHPLGERTLAGTYHAPVGVGDDDRAGGAAGARGTAGEDVPGPSAGQIEEFLDDLRHSIPGFDVGPADVRRVMAGTLPAVRAGTAELASREIMSVAAAAGGYAGLFSLIGVKYTTAPIAAGRAVAAVRNWLGETAGVTGAAGVRARRTVPGLDGFLALVARDPAAAGELIDAIVAEESVLSPSDLILRRTDWGLDPSDSDRAETALRSLRPEMFSQDE